MSFAVKNNPKMKIYFENPDSGLSCNVVVSPLNSVD